MGNFGSSSSSSSSGTSRPTRGSSSAAARQQQAQQIGVLSLRGFNITKVVLPRKLAVKIIAFSQCSGQKMILKRSRIP